jgi:tRNA (guanine37-N1)-methyltransferase
MRFDVVTLFPDLFGPFRTTGVLGRAVDKGRIEIVLHDLRDWAMNRWRQVDDEPYGGGAGMVIQAPPVLAAVRSMTGSEPCPHVVFPSPRGRVFDQAVAEELSREAHMVMVCGRYEGIDERALEILEPDEISLGDFVLGGGEVAAMVIIEAVTRLLPGVVGDPESVATDSFSDGLLDHPAYTRPAEVEGLEVPQVLRSGDHEAVRRWRLERAVRATVTRRPDLINRYWQRYPDEIRDLVRRLGGAPDDGAAGGTTREAT